MSNAWHHPPAREIEDKGRAVAGRVHAVVRRGVPDAHLLLIVTRLWEEAGR